MSRGECSTPLVALGPHTIKPSAWANSTDGEMAGNWCSAARHRAAAFLRGTLRLRPFGVPSDISCDFPRWLD